MNRKVIFGLIILVSAVLAVGGFWAWERNEKRADNQISQNEETKKNSVSEAGDQQNETENNLDRPVPPNSEDWRTAEWKVYRDEKNGFEIKYPGDLTAEEADQSSGGDVAFVLNIEDKELIPKNGGLFYYIAIRKTRFVNIDDWYKDWKKNNEKTIEARKTDKVLYDRVGESWDFKIQGFAAKGYILGGYPTFDTCESFIKKGLEYSFCYFGGARTADYDYAKIGDDGYGNNKYDDAKMQKIKDKYRKLLDEVVATFGFI